MNDRPESAVTGWSRRHFVSATAVTAIGLGTIPKGVGAVAPNPAEGESCIHAFSKPLHFLSYADAAHLVAEAGYGGIDYTVRPEGHVLPERVRDDLPRAVEAARAAGLRVEMITTAILRADEPHTTAILETAAGLGVKYYRLGWYPYDLNAGVWKTLENLRPVLRELAELNRRVGLHGAYQNHAGTGVGGALWDLHELLRDLDPRWIGCQFDIRHASAEGGLSWPVALRLLAPWIRCTDIKDFHWVQARGKATPETVPLGEGIVDFARYFGLTRELNLRGPISMHFEYPPFEPAPKNMAASDLRKALVAGLRRDRETLARHLAAGA